MAKKLITLDGLAVFLSELRKEINAGAGKCFDAEELARRIPSWQWKVTMPKTANQTVTATIGDQTYTSDFYALQGSNVTFSAQAALGYIAGNLSTTNTTLSKDLIVTITAATESENSGAETKTFIGGNEEFTVPLGVQVLKWTWGGRDVYVKTRPLRSYSVNIGKHDDVYGIMYIRSFDGEKTNYYGEDITGPYGVPSGTPLAVSWSKEINEHAIDYDWTK